ncbi:MAG TPA: hypothetical protein ENN63_12615 [Bacteroidetes bacterium]|nr:hypothetical protein [Bacteroidota bacterium]
MKKVACWLLLILFTVSCSKIFDVEDPFRKGLVSFGERPYYQNNHIVFSGRIQYGITGKPADIEYEVKEGSRVIASGKVRADNDQTGLKIIFESDLEDVYVPQDTYGGKKIVVFLDPDLKLVAEEYLDGSEVYQTDTLLIPYMW